VNAGDWLWTPRGAHMHRAAEVLGRIPHKGFEVVTMCGRHVRGGAAAVVDHELWDNLDLWECKPCRRTWDARQAEVAA